MRPNPHVCAPRPPLAAISDPSALHASLLARTRPSPSAATGGMADQQAAPAATMQADDGLQPGIRDATKPFTL